MPGAAPEAAPAAPAAPALADSGLSDFDYFRRYPTATTRIRSAWPDEFPRKILKQGGGRTAVVVVTIQRGADGAITRARGIAFIDGGRA